MIDEVAMAHSPQVWGLLPVTVKEELIHKAHEEAPPAIADLMRQMQIHIDDVFDIEDMVVSTLMKDKALLTDIFIRCGYQELCFIRNSGATMGGLFGIVQMIIFIFYKGSWILPTFGFVVGTITNWLALTMIFKPIEPHYPCGQRGIRIQGLFLQRQEQVAQVYGKVISKKILNSNNILSNLIAGPMADRLVTIMMKSIDDTCDRFFTGTSLPFVNTPAPTTSTSTSSVVPHTPSAAASASSSAPSFTSVLYSTFSRPILHAALGGADRYAALKADIVHKLIDRMPVVLISLEKYTDEALQMEQTLYEKLRNLPPREFEGLLHPVFEEDEWKLIVMGGVLGLAIGFVQLQILGS